jgi:hypothetical protein
MTRVILSIPFFQIPHVILSIPFFQIPKVCCASLFSRNKWVTALGNSTDRVLLRFACGIDMFLIEEQ